MKIFAFIVTYNRLDLLKRVVGCLRLQTCPIDKIIVVNNSSTDGTELWLQKQSDLLVIKQANLGGAGGFHTGVKYCFENGADWIWMMDDDVFPNSDCLDQLMKYTSVSACININRYYSDGVIVKCPHWYYQPTKLINPLYDECTDSQYIKAPEGGCFEGMLISRDLVEKIGYPDVRFFVYGDDTVYGYKACRYTQPIIVKNASAVRAQKSDDDRLRPMSTYYATRNRHLIKAYVREGVGDIKVSSAFSYYIMNPLIKTIRLLLSGYPNKYKEIKAYYWGIIDNVRKLAGPTHTLHEF